MKRRIHMLLATISVLAVILTAALSSIVVSQVLREQVMEDLKNYAEILLAAGNLELSNEGDGGVSSEIRITVIDAEGITLYDNKAEVSSMENHNSRPEVQQAREEGFGEAVRNSETIGRDTFYYAVLTKEGSVLRVAKEASSVWNLLLQMLPTVLVLMLVLVLLGIVASALMTKKLLAPIEQMANNMEHLQAEHVYKEMKPFVQTIQKQHEDIVKSSLVRQEFTANVSHELKTPLTAISGYSELMENGLVQGAEVMRFAGEIHKNANRLLTLINDIIRLSELDSGGGEYSREEIDLYQLAEQTMQLMKYAAEKQQLHLSVEGEHLRVWANRQMMDELVYNLCDNAVRYNNPGGRVRAAVYERNGEVILSVKDTGIGISKEHQERIFERFYRVDKSRSKATGGTGLGLAIVKHIVAQNQARIELDSEEGNGTEICVCFPAALRQNES